MTNALAQAWESRIKGHNASYRLFLKHWDQAIMPSTYRGSIIFVDDSQGFPTATGLQSMVAEFRAWANSFTPNDVMFQIGYDYMVGSNNDYYWWRNQSHPIPQTIGNAIASSINQGNPSQKVGIFWVDFTMGYTEVSELSNYRLFLESNPAAGGTLAGAGLYGANSLVNVSATPGSGYTFLRWELASGNASIAAPTNAATQVRIYDRSRITAQFEAQSANYTITASVTPAGAGTISPSGAVLVASGSSQTFTMSGNAGYVVNRVTVDGQNAGAVSSYTFTTVTANHTITAEFRAIASYGISLQSSNVNYVVAIPEGGSFLGSIVEQEEFPIADVIVDGMSKGPQFRTLSFSNVTGNHTVLTQNGTPVTYTLTASAGPNGTIIPSGAVTVTADAHQTFVFTPGSGYLVDVLTIDGAPVTPNGTNNHTISNIQKDMTIAVTFKAIPAVYTITASAGANGSIVPSGAVKVNEGANQSFTASPAAHYKVLDMQVDGASLGAVSGYTFTAVVADHTITVSFTPITWTITAVAGANGTISPSGSVVVNDGANQSFTITPAANYKVSDVKVDGVSKGAVTSFTFTNVTAGHTIEAAFAPVPWTITATAGANGTISPSGAVPVNNSANQSFTITPAANYKVLDVKVDGASQGAIAGYTFTNVTTNHTIAASFTPVQYTIGASAGSNGTISPSGTVTVNAGSNQKFTFTPASGYAVDKVTVDGVAVTPNGTNSHTISTIQKNYTIAVTFKVSSGVSCTGVAPWKATDPWTSYKVGDRRLDGSPTALYECTNVAYSYHQPSGQYGSYGWKKLGLCQ